MRGTKKAYKAVWKFVFNVKFKFVRDILFIYILKKKNPVQIEKNSG